MPGPGERQEPATSASFGYVVRRRRLALDLTQAALARRVGCSTVTVKKIEHDQRRPSRTMAERLADGLGVPDDERATFVAAGLGEATALGMALPSSPMDPGRPPPDWLASLTSSATTLPGFVGRGREMAVLDDHLAAAMRGRGHVAFVAGEAGRGKTALLTAFAARAQHLAPSLVVARGFGTAASGIGDPYLPFRDLFLMLLADPQAPWQADQLAAGQAQRLWDLAPTVARTIVTVGPELVDVLVPRRAIEPWLGDLAPAGPDTASRDQLVGQVTDVLATVARERPILLLLDDLQWLDAASADLVFHLARRLQGSQVLVLGAYRPSEIVGTAMPPSGRTLRQTMLEVRGSSDHAVLDLEDVDPRAARELCDALLDLEPHGLSEDFRTRLFRQTRGHPLFVVELLGELRARGELVRGDDGRWVQRDAVDWGALPSRVTAVIEQRLDRLDERERTLLELAAVQGEHFAAEVVAAGAGIDEGTATRVLARQLDQVHGLVRATGSSTAGGGRLTRFRFAHVLFQQYLYERLPPGEQARQHGVVAAQFERLRGDDPGPTEAALAHHYAEAGDAERAVTYLLRAGDRARMASAHDAAVGLYERAVDFLRARQDHETLARALMKLGLTYQTGFVHDRAQRAFDEAFALWSASPAAPAPSTAATLRLVWRDPPSLDPTMGGYNLTAPVLTQLLSGLVVLGEDNEVLPDVAERWEVDDDGRRYVFHLRDDVAWSDGTPVTAHDFEFTYRRALDPATEAPVAGSLLDAVAGAEAARSAGFDPDHVRIHAADARTLVIELREATSYFIQNLAYYVLLPVPRHVVELHGPDWATPEHFVGNGPFRLVAWEPGGEMVLERNPGYHGPAAGNVVRVHLDLGLSDDEQVVRYHADELDMLSTWFTSLPAFDRVRRRAPSDHVVQPAFITSYYFLGVPDPAFDDQRVRRALAMAVDRGRLAEVQLHGYASAATGGFVPPGMPGHVPDIALPFGPDEAARLLDEAGAAGLQLTLLGMPRTMDALHGIATAWDAVGCRTRVHLVDNVAQTAEVAGPTALFGGWWADYPDPDNFLRVDVELDLPDWRERRYWDLIERANAARDQQERLALFGHAERVLVDEAVLVPLLYQPQHLLVKPWIASWPSPAVKYPGFWKDVTVSRDRLGAPARTSPDGAPLTR